MRAALFDADLDSAIEVARPAGRPPSLQLSDIPAPQTIRSATPVRARSGGTVHRRAVPAPQLEASDDGSHWRPIAELPLGHGPDARSASRRSPRAISASCSRRRSTPAFDVRALRSPGLDLSGASARLLRRAASLTPRRLRVGDFRLSTEDRIDRAEAKAAFSLVPDYYRAQPATCRKRRASRRRR